MDCTKNLTVGITTLGCKVNQYESEAIAEELEKHGFTVQNPSLTCDAYIINTCTVTAESDRKARQFIRRAITKNPNAIIVVTGCLAQTSPEEIAKIEGVDAVVGNSEKLLCVKALEELLCDIGNTKEPKIYHSDIDSAAFEQMSIMRFERTRAYVKIEDGCENKCTYCIIPAARGRVRSKAPEALLCEVGALTRGGCREIVLTGIETASYGKDLEGIDLAALLCRVDKIEGIGRVRLGSLDPSLIKPAFVEKISSLNSLAPHFHLSLQSGSNKILALMKRKYNAKMALDAINLLRENMPRVKFTTDIIVGFPDESEEDFQCTLEFVRRARFLHAHIFPYSKRAGTPAAEMDGQIPKSEKERRLKILSDECAKIKASILQSEIEAESAASVLFESFNGEYAIGHTEDFIEVWVRSNENMHGKIGRIKFEKTDGERIFASLSGEIF